jgi:hypothetical protein
MSAPFHVVFWPTARHRLLSPWTLTRKLNRGRLRSNVADVSNTLLEGIATVARQVCAVPRCLLANCPPPPFKPLDAREQTQTWQIYFRRGQCVIYAIIRHLRQSRAISHPFHVVFLANCPHPTAHSRIVFYKLTF